MSGTKAAGLTKEDIVTLLDQGVEALRLNKSFMTDAILLKIHSLLEDARDMRESLQRLAGLTPEQVDLLLKAGEKFLAIERKLVKTDLGERLEQTMDGLKNRPVILNMIAALL